MTDIVVCYKGKSHVTGKALYKKLKQDPRFARVRRVRKNKKVKKTDVFIRWGNSTSYNPARCLQINKPESIVNASSKKRMIRLLSETEGVDTPPFFFVRDYNRLAECDREEFLKPFKDDEGNFFIRNNMGVVRYDNTFTDEDDYVMQPIDKTREYRVHVFDGEVIGIYEKIPNEGESGLIRKDNNCQFSKSDPAISRCNLGAQEMSIKAVKELGLTFGGVDIIRQKLDDNDERKFFITEVNSSPALNENNIDIYIDRFASYIANNIGGNRAIT